MRKPAIWWTGILFATGSACFAVAALASLPHATPRAAIGVTFFAGSLFFTSAGYLQHWMAVREADTPLRGTGTHPLEPKTWSRKHVDVLATLIQLIGTVLFNVNTFEAMQSGLDAHQSNLRVWTPDVLGSICFLAASQLALSNTCRAWLPRGPRTRDWWIAVVNMLGSIAFGVSAVTSLIQPSTNEPVSATITNVATALGAIGFLIGALLLLPPRSAPRGSSRDSPSPTHP